MADDVDRALLDRFVQGDQDAFESLFRQFDADVYRWILRIVRDPSAADDVLVEAFWRAYRGRARYDPTRTFGAWMRRIATNAALDQLKVMRRHRAVPVQVDTLAAPQGPDRDVGDIVARAFQTLPPALQVVAVLALVEERPYSEIADALALPVGTVKSRVFRATRALRRELERLGITP
jgi:RNA polymerase sigma-70 factor (ECF subfamily)